MADAANTSCLGNMVASLQRWLRVARPMAASHFKKNRQALSLLSSLPKRPARFSERTTGFVML
jgi:hypothetical protein